MEDHLNDYLVDLRFKTSGHAVYDKTMEFFRGGKHATGSDYFSSHLYIPLIARCETLGQSELESVVSFWLLRVEKYLESVSALNRAMSFLRLWVLFGSTLAAAVIAADIARDGAPDLSLTFVAAIIMASVTISAGLLFFGRYERKLQNCLVAVTLLNKHGKDFLSLAGEYRVGCHRDCFKLFIRNLNAIVDNEETAFAGVLAETDMLTVHGRAVKVQDPIVQESAPLLYPS